MLTQVKRIDMIATGKLYNNASKIFGVNCFWWRSFDLKGHHGK